MPRNLPTALAHLLLPPAPEAAEPLTGLEVRAWLRAHGLKVSHLADHLSQSHKVVHNWCGSVDPLPPRVAHQVRQAMATAERNARLVSQAAAWDTNDDDTTDTQ